MKQALTILIAVVAAGSTGAIAVAAESTLFVERGEPWVLGDDAATQPRVLRGPGLDHPVSTGTSWSTSNGSRRFVSGLEDDAPVRRLDVFHQSGLEGLTSTRTKHVRFGSGLEDDVPLRSPNVFRQSGF